MDFLRGLLAFVLRGISVLLAISLLLGLCELVYLLITIPPTVTLWQKVLFVILSAVVLVFFYFVVGILLWIAEKLDPEAPPTTIQPTTTFSRVRIIVLWWRRE